jgi:glycosyltransferase involved in cell wall biosynthesis
MKVLLVSNGFPPTDVAGTELHTHHLALALGREHDVAVFCRTRDPAAPPFEVRHDTVDGVRVRRIVNNVLYPPRDPLRLRIPAVEDALERCLAEEQPDVVHVHHAIALGPSLLSLLRTHGVRCVLTLHDFWWICPRVTLFTSAYTACRGPAAGCLRCTVPHPLGALDPSGRAGMLERLKCRLRGFQARLAADRWRRFFDSRAAAMQRALAAADVILAPSDAARDLYAANGVSGERVRVLPHGVPPVVPAPGQPGGRTVFRVGFVGNLLPYKGAHTLVAAFRKAALPTAELVLHGPACEPRYARLLRRMAAGLPVTFAGRFARAEAGRVYAGLDLVVVPSLCPESFSFVVREAQQADVPVVAARIGALPKAIEGDPRALAFEPGNVDDLAEKLRAAAGGSLGAAGAPRPTAESPAAHAAAAAAVYRPRGDNT